MRFAISHFARARLAFIAAAYAGSFLSVFGQAQFIIFQPAYFITQAAYGRQPPEQHDPPVLYNLDVDPSEKYNLAAGNAEVIAELREVVAQHRKTVDAPASQLEVPLAN